MEDVLAIRHSIGEHFKHSAKEANWPESKIHDVIASLNKLSTTSSYTAAGFIGGFLFYARVEVGFKPPHDPTGYVFDGNAGGLFGLGVSSLNGQVYTDDLSRLVNLTESFHFATGVPYSNVMFFDGGGNLLGYCSAVSVGSMAGAGGGGGNWVHG